MRTAGVGQPHDFGAFVKGLAGGVIYGFAQDFHVVVVLDKYQLRVAALNEQTQKRILGHLVLGLAPYEVRQYVCVQVVDVYYRTPQTQ